MITSDKYPKEKYKSMWKILDNKVYKESSIIQSQKCIYKRHKFINMEMMVLPFVPAIFWLSVKKVLSLNPLIMQADQL